MNDFIQIMIFHTFTKTNLINENYKISGKKTKEIVTFTNFFPNICSVLPQSPCRNFGGAPIGPQSGKMWPR